MKKKKSDEAGGLLFVGGLMLGIGFGLLFGHVASGTMIGLGVGFIAMAIYYIVRKK